MPPFGVQFLFYRDDEYFQDATRREYFDAIPSDWLARSVIFFDPDIGLETGTLAYMRRNGTDKYLMYGELSGVAARATDDSIFVIYQHLQNDATKRTGDVERRLRDLLAHLPAATAWAVQWTDVAFLVAVCNEVLATRVRLALREHAGRHGGMLSEVGGHPSGLDTTAVVDALDSLRIERVSGGDVAAHAPKATNGEVRRSAGGTMTSKSVRLDDIVAYLNAAQVRATYGAVARVVGGMAQSIGARLGGAAGRRPEASWIVNTETGLPSGYLPAQYHPALLKNRDIITSGEDLRRRLAEWEAAGAPRRAAAVDSRSTTQVPVLRKRPVVSEPPSPQAEVKPLSVDDLADLRRKLTTLLNLFDTTSRGQSEGIGTRISRLSHDGGPIPRVIAALMKTITEMRNSAEYESKVLSASECAVVRHAWQAIQEWAQSVRRS